MIDSFRIVAAFSAAAYVAGAAVAQPVPDTSPEAAGKSTSAMTDHVTRLQATRLSNGERVATSGKPLFGYSDAARIIADGGIWAWGSEGRPVAMAKVWKNSNGTRTCAFSLTSAERVVVHGPEFKTWQPEQIQVEPSRLNDAPAAEQQNANRLRQLKEQARRFTAHEFWNPDNSRFELRLLAQPVHRYQDEKRDIVDGAVFLLAI
ncbi:MAG TPA: hypothetical protein VKH44_00835, partial [Pirellulaceae bacterium]|nr:hypothetical protein [Pirellulaceae bacterium]